ncbi:ABC transporter ATP-binding protein [Haloechinothrix sp. YIM 98757]|uniref:ABC transporter ATP-binding protein n=1 Tax=Haloechinothrix aidingensis TaxID=2752311 RepID=A0A838A910_9PSEU|nr:ABC transporter ATP-binding protein [Haloechinothrix aidingensis]MBA0125061.1 ABC transporter ATP-binding protein [Haloechinothrix aidingensis]
MSTQPHTTGGRIATSDLTLGYDGSPIISELSLELPPARITCIVGANGCGKSTLLRGLGRLLRPRDGSVTLDGEEIARMPTGKLATRLGLLPQQPLAPDGITVSDLVGRGRHPHQRWFRQWSRADEAAVRSALDATGLTGLSDAAVDELSGGQRQRAWIALALAQQTETMLLDEPTTFLDLAHQIEVLDLLAELNSEHGRTVVLVLHDLNLACRYADHLIAMRDGAVAATGEPAEIVTADLVREVFGLPCEVMDDPLTHTPLVLPRPGARKRR